MPRCLLVVLLLAGRMAPAQNGYSLVGDARPGLLPDCYQLTASRAWQNGAVWYDQPLRLTESFSLEFTVNLGADGFGADGVVLVMQTVGNRAIGEAGLGIGFKGLRPSLGIEFDTFRNAELGDPALDHVALVRDGISDHRGNSGFAAPVQLSAVSTNAKDGRDHRVQLAWDAPARLLSVRVDCVVRISQAIDLVNGVFGGTSSVYWGFTSATGGSTNTHTVCLQKDIVARDTFRVCRGDALTLVAGGQSANDRYDWQPATGLSDPGIRAPRLTPAADQLYTVSYRDRCFTPHLDSVFVRVQTPPTLDLGSDRAVCENIPVELTPQLTPLTASTRFRWSTGDTTRRLRPLASGTYTLRVTAGSCSVADSVALTFNPLPVLEPLTGPGYECLREQPLSLDPRASGPGLRYAWTPGGSTAPTLTASAAGTYSVQLKTDFGCAAERRFTVRDDCPVRVFVPEVFSPNGDGTNDVLEWKSAEALEGTFTVFDRWGEVVFSSENSLEFWDGTHRGQSAPPGRYVWRLEARPRRSSAGGGFVQRGAVVLVR